MKTVLVLTNSNDGKHSDIVVDKLRERGEKVFRFDVDIMTSGLTKVIFHAQQEGLGFTFETDSAEGILSSQDIKSIWYRRPNFLNLTIKDPVQRAYAEREISHFLEGLWLSQESVPWVNHPHNIARARRKILQLQIAMQYGLSILPTIITNDPDRIRRFYRDHGSIVFKAIHGEFLDYGDRGYTIPTTLISERHLERVDTFGALPYLFQKFVDKVSEVRVTVVGKKIFAIQIRPLSSFEPAIDWRNPRFHEHLDHTIIALPPPVERACMEIMQFLKLRYAAFDFVVDREGQMHFLEVNPNGQWYWLEHLTGALITEAIVDILAVPQ